MNYIVFYINYQIVDDLDRPNGPECGTNVIKGFNVHKTQTFPMIRQGATPVMITVFSLLINKTSVILSFP